MNADILKRIVRAIADGSQGDLDRLAAKSSSRSGKAATPGLPTSSKQFSVGPDRPRTVTHQPLTANVASRNCPLSRRHGELLATLIPREALEHHMVLPAATEDTICPHRAGIRRPRTAGSLRPDGHARPILLYGPPGCGKSLGAKRLAWNTGLPLLKVRFDALISSYFGESATNLRTVFVAAKERPCVLLLDECDFIARSRINSKDIGEASRIVNSLLQLMEEYDAPGLLMATTNIESSLDDALFRRFDDVFQVPLPGPEEVEKLLKMTLSAVQVSERLAWKCPIEKLAGASAAMVVKAAQDAAKAAVLGGQKIVTESHLKNAVAELKRSDGEAHGG